MFRKHFLIKLKDFYENISKKLYKKKIISVEIKFYFFILFNKCLEI